MTLSRIPTPVSRRAVLRSSAALGLALGALPARVFAEAAAAPVKLIVPFTPGTTPDLCARLLSPSLQASLNRTFIVDNRAGASGMIGMDAVNKSAPDGTTLMFGTSTGLTLPLVYAKVPFDVIKGFSPITMLGYTNFGLVVHPSVPARNMTELAAWVKAQPNPPDYSSPGKGTFQHLCMEWISFLTGTRFNHVPYKGSGPALADLMGGHVKMSVVPLHIAMPLVADGKLAVIGSTRKERDPRFPTVTPLAESGLPALDADAWYAVWGPAGLPAKSAADYGTAIAQAMASPEAVASLAKLGVTPHPTSPEELHRLSVAEFDKWSRLVRDIKLAPE